MAIRTSEDAVKLIIEVDDSVDLTPFIEVANNIVDQVCLNSNYSDATLELIERWLSAHFYSVRDPRSTREEVKGIVEEFEGQSGLGLAFTRYGQQCLLIDTQGNLAKLESQAAASSNGSHIPANIQMKYIGGRNRRC